MRKKFDTTEGAGRYTKHRLGSEKKPVVLCAFAEFAALVSGVPRSARINRSRMREKEGGTAPNHWSPPLVIGGLLYRCPLLLGFFGRKESVREFCLHLELMLSHIGRNARGRGEDKRIFARPGEGQFHQVGGVPLFGFGHVAYYSYGPDAYVSFALNPSVFPNGTGSGEVTILGRPKVKEGDQVTLQALLSYMVGEVTIGWYKDGEVISGATGAEYRIDSVVPEDAGEYRVLVTDQSKGLYESPPFVLQVVSAESMPVSGLAAVVVFALVLSWVGIRQCRPFRVQRPKA